ncbi:MAG: hypothetical protein KC635_26725, partial [Myxococcales bacterium]|nr:hypothetical protein [Myxococcales bacterium]
MTLRHRRAAAVGLGAAAILGLVWHALPGGDAPPPAPEARPTATSEAAPAPAPGTTPEAPVATPSVAAAAQRPEVRLAGRYAFDYALDFTIEKGELHDFPTRSKLAVTGTLVLTDGADGWLHGHLEAPTVTGDRPLVKQAQLDPDAPAAGADRAFAVRLDARGQIVERRFDRATPLGVRNVLGTLFGALQVVAPEEGDAVAETGWSTREAMMDGPAEADYRVTRAGLDKTWRTVTRDPSAQA